MTQQEEHQKRRQELWCNVAINVSRAENCKTSNTSISWANDILEAFDRKFPTATSSKNINTPKES